MPDSRKIVRTCSVFVLIFAWLIGLLWYKLHVTPDFSLSRFYLGMGLCSMGMGTFMAIGLLAAGEDKFRG